MRKCIILVFLLLSASLLFAENIYLLYKNQNEPVERRVEDLLSRMTLKEKLAQLQNLALHNFSDIQKIKNDGIGTAHEMSLSAEDCASLFAELQRFLIDSTRLGIPALTGVEGIQGILQNGCTIFPHAIAQGSTFNPSLIEKMTEVAGKEAEVIGIHQILSPVLDIARELRWGRVEETFGEDPYLISEIGGAFVRGYQKSRITCMPKHFVAYGSSIRGLNMAQSSGGEREMRSLYLYPFEKIIKEYNPLAIMSSYGVYDGIAISGSRYYLTDILRGDLGFNGYVYSDWGAVKRLNKFHYMAETIEDAARKALYAGVDLCVDPSYKTLEKQVEEGFVDINIIDNAVRRILYVKFKLGIFDSPNGDVSSVRKIVRSPEHIRISREVADESAVLLKNDGILPLDLSKYRHIAVVGPNGNHAVFGDYCWAGADSHEGVTLLKGLENVLSEGISLSYAPGCDWWSSDSSGFDEALSLARKSDLVIVALGTRSTYMGRHPDKVTSGENFDLSSLDVPGVQMELLKEIKKTGKPIVLVLITGRPLVLTWAKENVNAILLQWYAGEEQGNSAADILVGKVNPSGKLNVSFPRSTGNIPCYYNQYPFHSTDRNVFPNAGSPDNPGRHYVFEEPTALWNFGYGLSYTNFKYTDFKVSNNIVDESVDTIKVSVNVTNIGKRSGKEVVQLYVRDMYSSVAQPVQQLKAFSKIELFPGQTKTVELFLPVKELVLYDENMNKVVESGDFELRLGRSSDDIQFRDTLTVVRNLYNK